MVEEAEKLKLCQGPCGLWRPLSYFQRRHRWGVIIFKKCRICCSRNSAINFQRIKNDPDHKHILAERATSPKQAKPWVSNSKRRTTPLFSEYPSHIRQWAEGHLAKLMAKHKDKLSGPNASWYKAHLIGSTTGLANWLLAHPGKTLSDRMRQLMIIGKQNIGIRRKLGIKLLRKPRYGDDGYTPRECLTQFEHEYKEQQ